MVRPHHRVARAERPREVLAHVEADHLPDLGVLVAGRGLGRRERGAGEEQDEHDDGLRILTVDAGKAFR